MSPSLSPGLGNSGNAPPFGVLPSSPARDPCVAPSPRGFVGDVELGSSFNDGRTLTVEFGGRPSLIACFC